MIKHMTPKHENSLPLRITLLKKDAHLNMIKTEMQAESNTYINAKQHRYLKLSLVDSNQRSCVPFNV